MQDSAQEEAIEKQYKADLASWNYQYDEAIRGYQWDKQQTRITKRNTFQDIKYQDKARRQDWKFEMQMRDFDYANQMRAYNVSEQMYGMQLNFNQMAAQTALQSEMDWLNERVTEAAFQHEGMVLDMYQTQAQTGFLAAENLLNFKNAEGQAALQNRAINMAMRQAMGDAALERIGLRNELDRAYDVAKTARAQNRLDLRKTEEGVSAERTQLEVKKVQDVGANLAFQSGRSAEKIMQSALMQVGMQHNVLNQAIASSEKSFKIAKREIQDNVRYAQKNFDLGNKLVDKKVRDTVEQSMQKSMEVSFNLGIAKSNYDLSKNKINSDYNFAYSQFGLGQRSLNASLQSAAQSVKTSLQKINADKFGADINAFGNRMLQPIMAPKPPKPRKLPRPEFLMPLKPTKPPKPIKGAGSNNTATAIFDGIAGIAASAFT